MENKRFMFCRNCLKLWQTKSEKKFVDCVCGSKTSTEMNDSNDLFKIVHGLNCYHCRHTWFSKARAEYIQCSQCGKKVRQIIGVREFRKYFIDTGIDGLNKLLKHFPNISRIGFIMMSIRLHPNINENCEDAKEIWKNHTKILYNK